MKFLPSLMLMMPLLIAGGPAPGPPHSPPPPEAAPTDDNAPMLASMRAQMDTVNACYDDVIKRFPTVPGGTFDIELTIDPNGAVSKSEVKGGPFQDPTFFKCLATVLTRWKLPPDGLQTKLTVPFTFSPPVFTPLPAPPPATAPAKAPPKAPTGKVPAAKVAP